MRSSRTEEDEKFWSGGCSRSESFVDMLETRTGPTTIYSPACQLRSKGQESADSKGPKAHSSTGDSRWNAGSRDPIGVFR